MKANYKSFKSEEQANEWINEYKCFFPNDSNTSLYKALDMYIASAYVRIKHFSFYCNIADFLRFIGMIKTTCQRYYVGWKNSNHATAIPQGHLAFSFCFNFLVIYLFWILTFFFYHDYSLPSKDSLPLSKVPGEKSLCFYQSA